jgi:hypothetical protein
MTEILELSDKDMEWVTEVAFNEFNGKSDEDLGDRCVNCSMYDRVDSDKGLCRVSDLEVVRTDCCWMFLPKVVTSLK